MADHGQAQQEVAFVAGEAAQPCALAAHHQGQRAVQALLVEQGHIRPAVQPGDPDVARLEVFDGAVEVGDLGHGHALDRARAAVGHGRGNACGAAVGQDDTVDAHGLGGADQRAEVLRVLQVVEDEQQRRFACGFGARQQVVYLHIGIVAHFQRDALGMGVLLGQLLEEAAFDRAHRHVGSLGGRGDLAEDAGGRDLAFAFQPEAEDAAAGGA